MPKTAFGDRSSSCMYHFVKGWGICEEWWLGLCNRLHLLVNPDVRGYRPGQRSASCGSCKSDRNSRTELDFCLIFLRCKYYAHLLQSHLQIHFNCSASASASDSDSDGIPCTSAFNKRKNLSRMWCSSLMVLQGPRPLPVLAITLQWFRRRSSTILSWKDRKLKVVIRKQSSQALPSKRKLGKYQVTLDIWSSEGRDVGPWSLSFFFHFFRYPQSIFSDAYLAQVDWESHVFPAPIRWRTWAWE